MIVRQLSSTPEPPFLEIREELASRGNSDIRINLATNFSACLSARLPVKARQLITGARLSRARI